MGDSVYFLIAVSIVLIFVFPLYWGLSTSLRAPMDTFTVTGLGIPGIHFDPTLNNWLDQLVVPEMRKSIFNSIVISISSSFLALALGIGLGLGGGTGRFIGTHVPLAQVKFRSHGMPS